MKKELTLLTPYFSKRIKYIKCKPFDWSHLKSIKMIVEKSNAFSLTSIVKPTKCCNKISFLKLGCRLSKVISPLSFNFKKIL